MIKMNELSRDYCCTPINTIQATRKRESNKQHESKSMQRDTVFSEVEVIVRTFSRTCMYIREENLINLTMTNSQKIRRAIDKSLDLLFDLLFRNPHKNKTL